ncbi:hypothetical protein [Enterobacter mori]
MGFYNASKWAVEALHESLATEVSGLGLISPSSNPASTLPISLVRHH